MKTCISLFLLVLFSSFLSLSANEEKMFDGAWIDLTHEFSDETIYWPTADTFKKTVVFEGHNPLGFFYAANNFSGAEHGGTHVDAPIHFYKGRQTIDQIPVDQFIGPGIVIRVTEKTKLNRNYQFSVEDIKAWEKVNGRIPDNSILFVDTGSAQFWPDLEKYMGTSERGQAAVAKLKFPGIHPKAAKFLTAQRKIKAIGLDTPSIDFGASKLFRSHQIFFEQNIPGLENITNLDQLPLKGFTAIGLPMKIKGGSGGPLRIVAFIPNN